MGGLTDDRPKCLVELGGRPLLDWQVAALHKAGVEKIGIVVGWRKPLLAGRVAELFENPRWAETNMVASLACASAWLESDACIVSYSDIFYSPAAVEALRATSADIAITYDRNWLNLWSRRFKDPLSDAESLAVNSEGYLTDIGRRTTNISEIQGQYMGLLRFNPSGWRKVCRFLSELSSEERDGLDMTALLQRVVSRGTRVAALPIEGGWGEIDSSSDLALYQKDIEDGKLMPPPF